MTLIRGGFCGPNGLGGAYQNEVETDRSAVWFANGARQGVLKGFVASQVAGQMALDLSAGAALVSERDASGVVQDRGYLVWADAVTRVTFGPASVAARNDAVVAAFVDTEDGPVGTGGLEVGPHLVVVPGVSGTTAARTDTEITAWLGRGGWVRLYDVPIASTDTQINTAAMADRGFKIGAWNDLKSLVTVSTGWSLTSAQYMRDGRRVFVRGICTRTGASITSTTGGDITDSPVATGLPADLQPDAATYIDFDRNGLQVYRGRVNGGEIALTSFNVGSYEMPSGTTLTFSGSYYVA